MKTIWMEDEKDSTECPAWYRDTLLLAHVHFGWATEPVNEISRSCFLVSPTFQVLSPTLIISTGMPLAQCYQEKFSTGTVKPLSPKPRLPTYSKRYLGASSFFKKTK